MARLESLPPPPGATSFPDGGEVGPIRSGWRLVLREFMRSRLAILGLATLVFFVLFCFAGSLVYHGNLTSTNLAGFVGVRARTWPALPASFSVPCGARSPAWPAAPWTRS